MNATGSGSADIKVSVAMITYNHERFIAQAIDSVLMQQTDFEYELVIGEDRSTDGTRAIVRAYGESYSERIRLLLPQHNLGMIPNFVATLEACRGQYVALLEGDDYWTDPLKLQKQVDFLESHPDCSLCFHNATSFYQDGSADPTPMRPPDQKVMLSTEDLLMDVSVPTCSAMFRNGLISVMPPWYYELMMGDWPLWVLLSRYGKLGYINEMMAAYRIHPGGVWSGARSMGWISGHLRALDVFDQVLDFAYHDLIEQAKTSFLDDKVEEFLVAASSSSSPKEAVRTFQDLWRQYLSSPPPLDKRLLGRHFGTSFYRAAKSGDYATVRKSAWGLALYERPHFRNRGAWSLLFEACFGKRVTALRKAIASKFSVWQLSHHE